jgi:hypothetical protein
MPRIISITKNYFCINFMSLEMINYDFNIFDLIYSLYYVSYYLEDIKKVMRNTTIVLKNLKKF